MAWLYFLFHFYFIDVFMLGHRRTRTLLQENQGSDLKISEHKTWRRLSNFRVLHLFIHAVSCSDTVASNNETIDE
jgi:hypothetical protein